MGDSKIEWTEKVWNVVSGCTKISEGCRHCYAERMSRRLAGRYGYPQAPHNFDVTLHPDRLGEPLRWKKPRRVFVCSMSDLFHVNVPYDFILDVFNVIAQCPQHTFLILTKRPARMRDVLGRIREGKYDEVTWTGSFPGAVIEALHDWPWHHIWLGVTAENQHAADERIPILLEIPAAVRFVSVEPMLEPMHLHRYLLSGAHKWRRDISLVIAGGESGTDACPMHPDWVRALRDQCQVADTQFFFKQHGAWLHHSQINFKTDEQPEAWSLATIAHEWPDGTWSKRVGKKIAGRLLDGREWNEYPNRGGS